MLQSIVQMYRQIRNGTGSPGSAMTLVKLLALFNREKGGKYL